MNSNRKKQIGLLLIVVIVAGLLAVVTGAGAAQVDPPVVPPDGTWDDKTYGELGADWWQWALAIPAFKDHPNRDRGKVDCSMGQADDGEVWFLAGAAMNNRKGVVNVKRTCEDPVPVGKALFFPIVNIICSELTGDEGDLEEICDQVVNDFIPVDSLSASIDGNPVENLVDFRTKSPYFDIAPLPAPNIIHAPAGSEAPAVTDGYYLLLEPLDEGEHDIEFSGKIVAPDYGIDWTLIVRYEFTVGDDD